MATFTDRTLVLVVDKESRKVLDAQRCNYSWDLEGIVQRHDLEKVDLILRLATDTAIQPDKVEEPIEEAPAPIADVSADEDIPF